jgi:phosphoribosylformylglycinamidine cyclo-ligase
MARADRYREAGVDLRAAEETTERIKVALRNARSELALGEVGAFGGMVRVPADVSRPVLVSSMDGVGTKVLVATRAGVHNTVGEDLVNHCVDDILVHGARPIAFLDYIGIAKVDPDVIAELVDGVARACVAHGMTLTGGETAELPDLYPAGHYDLAGTIIGVVGENDVLHGDRVEPGDALVGYASTGLHTNGYSLARRIVFEQLHLDVDSHVDELGTTVGQALLAVHRSYWNALKDRFADVHALAHITGGGIRGNLVRALPHGCGAVVDSGGWTPLPIFSYLQGAGNVSRNEMFDVFNMGVGLIAVAPPGSVDRLRQSAADANVDTWVMGEVICGAGVRID